MYGLAKIKELIKRAGLKQRLAAFAIAALISLAALPAPARAQNGISGPDFQFQSVASVGLARGETLRVTVPNLVQPNKDGRSSTGGTARSDVQRSRITALVVTFDRPIDPVVQTDEIEIPAGGFYSFDINRDDINLPGEPGTGRLQLWIEVWSVRRSGGRVRVEESEAGLFLPTFEVMANASGRTTVHGTLTKVGTGTLIFPNKNTY